MAFLSDLPSIFIEDGLHHYTRFFLHVTMKPRTFWSHIRNFMFQQFQDFFWFFLTFTVASIKIELEPLCCTTCPENYQSLVCRIGDLWRFWMTVSLTPSWSWELATLVIISNYLSIIWSRLLIHPRGVEGAHEFFWELCKYRFDSSGKGGSGASPGTHSYPWNKQRVSFRAFKYPLFSKPLAGQVLFLTHGTAKRL